MTNTTTREYYVVKINHSTLGWQTQPEQYAFIEDAEADYIIKKNEAKIVHIIKTIEEEEIQ